MPVFEHVCPAPECARHLIVEERYFAHRDAPPPPCEACGAVTLRIPSVCNVPFLGPITARYNDPTKEYAHREGHFAYQKKTPDGVPKPVFIETFEQQKKFCKHEGLGTPGDINPNARISSDGHKIETAGVKGQWV